jgi:hypothetical protein
VLDRDTLPSPVPDDAAAAPVVPGQLAGLAPIRVDESPPTAGVPQAASAGP